MIRSPRRPRLLAPAVLVLSLSPTGRAHARGTPGHRSIASRYGESLPPALQALRADGAWITDHVMDPDLRERARARVVVMH